MWYYTLPLQPSHKTKHKKIPLWKLGCGTQVPLFPNSFSCTCSLQWVRSGGGLWLLLHSQSWTLLWTPWVSAVALCHGALTALDLEEQQFIDVVDVRVAQLRALGGSWQFSCPKCDHTVKPWDLLGKKNQPNKPVSSCCVARPLTQTLNLCGCNIDTLLAHSFKPKQWR